MEMVLNVQRKYLNECTNEHLYFKGYKLLQCIDQLPQLSDENGLESSGRIIESLSNL